jgi:protein-arginine deiminase
MAGGGGGGGDSGGQVDPLPKFHMHLDCDRDGTVDKDWRVIGSWKWGRGKLGALFFCNNDDDGGRKKPDNSDNTVNGGKDKNDLAPIFIRKKTGHAAPGSWKGYLSVDVEDVHRVRVFDKFGAGGNEVIGPTTGKNEYELPNLSFTEKQFGIEAVFYAGEIGAQYNGSDWDGRVIVTFRIEDGGPATVVCEYKGRLQVAPWMMPHHLEKAEKVYVVTTADNGRFVGDLNPLVSGAGCSLEKYGEPNDRWMQDCMEIGYSFLPKHHMPVVFKARRPRPLQKFPKDKLLKSDFGFEEPAPIPLPSPRPPRALPPELDESDFDSHGNLEVTPPGKSAGGKAYPWGRIYFGGVDEPGRIFNPHVRTFLMSQTVQPAVQIDTTWLAVGHVDEIMTFVPGGPKGFKLLLAAPRLAYKILERAVLEGNGAAKMLVGRDFHGTPGEVSIDDFLTSGIPGIGGAVELQVFNEGVAVHMARTRRKMKKALSLVDSDILSVPILFMENPDFVGKADAMTAGMVNMLVLNKHCIIPKPFGPVVKGIDLFEENMRWKLKKQLGLTVKFIDDWYEYHVINGEVHCGTNTLRKPVPAKWKWWEFLP